MCRFDNHGNCFGTIASSHRSILVLRSLGQTGRLASFGESGFAFNFLGLSFFTILLDVAVWAWHSARIVVEVGCEAWELQRVVVTMPTAGLETSSCNFVCRNMGPPQASMFVRAMAMAFGPLGRPSFGSRSQDHTCT